MSTLVIVLIVVFLLLDLLVVGGYLAAKRRRGSATDYAQHVAAADRALEEARAVDRGWSRETIEEAARRALDQERPGWAYRELHLVLVDDRPGVTEDRAHVVAVGDDAQVRVVMGRDAGGDWRVHEFH